jgi:hypothetical protein
MEIRCNSIYIKEFDELLKKNAHRFHDRIYPANVTLDNALDEPIIMAKMQDGSLQEWTSGYENVKSMLMNGYVRIIQQCPLNKYKECKGEDCQLYLIRNLTGDCSLKWSAILSFDR